jgi:hypothetical protein
MKMKSIATLSPGPAQQRSIPRAVRRATARGKLRIDLTERPGTVVRMHRALALVVVLSLSCGSPPPPPPSPTPKPVAPAPPPPPEKVKVETGKDCAKAEATCSGGLCDVEVDNGCAEPVSCDVTATAVCKTDAEMLDAQGRGRGTVPAKSKGKLSAVADCTRGVVMTTSVKEMRCR